MSKYYWNLNSWIKSLGERKTLSICYSFILLLYYICITFVLHVWYICKHSRRKTIFKTSNKFQILGSQLYWYFSRFVWFLSMIYFLYIEVCFNMSVQWCISVEEIYILIMLVNSSWISLHIYLNMDKKITNQSDDSVFDAAFFFELMFICPHFHVIKSCHFLKSGDRKSVV